LNQLNRRFQATETLIAKRRETFAADRDVDRFLLLYGTVAERTIAVVVHEAAWKE
jgi:hypothetical protein